MKLFLICENPLEKIGGDYYAVDSWMRFHLNLAKHCHKLTLWAPVILREAGATPAPQAWRVDRGNLQIVDNDYYNTFVKYYRLWLTKAWPWKQKAMRLASEHDAILIFHPSPMSPMISWVARKLNKPLVVFLMGDLKAQSDRILGHSGLKKLFYKTLVNFWVRQEIRCCRNASLIYAYSHDLLTRHKKSSRAVIKISRDIHLTLDDFFEREDTCLNAEVAVSRVCWLIPSKGIEYLIEAIAILVKRGMPVRLELMGQERIKGYQRKLEQLAEGLGIREKVNFRGWIPFNRLGPVYIDSDIQVISSLAEGTPRVIIEGGARGVPLVATTVGGCPDALQDGMDALLVPPANSAALADAMERIIKDGPLRRRLIQNGYKAARNASFEYKGLELLNDLKQLL